MLSFTLLIYQIKGKHHTKLSAKCLYTIMNNMLHNYSPIILHSRQNENIGNWEYFITAHKVVCTFFGFHAIYFLI